MNDAPFEVAGIPARSAGNDMARNWKAAGICILLVALVFAVFGQAAGFGFVNLDDLAYVPENPMVSKGLSLAGIAWAFTHVHAGLWHPLTVILLMLDRSMFGLWPGGYHLVNVLLHAVCAVVLFRVLLEMTGAAWRSGFVAALFAIHPLRAESVIWITECKDVLSGMFFMLTLLAYVRYARGPRSNARYSLVLVCFALGLMSKSMLVTVPCVLLLLDYWPLGRLQTLSQLPALVREKIPLFALSALSSLATVLAISAGDHPRLQTYPAAAPIAYVIYLAKLIYPAHLALPYPIPVHGWPAWQVFGALLLLTAMTAGAWLLRRKQPFLLTGWLWYLGMLVPVVRAMQTDYPQAYADRFTYLPQIGLCFAGTWLAADLARRWRLPSAMQASIAGVIITALTITAWQQAAYWRNSITLWTHTLECTRDNYYGHYILGNAFFRESHLDEAAAQFRESLRIDPAHKEARLDLGALLVRQGRFEEAGAQYREALKLESASAPIRYHLGNALLRQGRFEEAAQQFAAAARIDPALVGGLNDVGNALLQRGRANEAIAEYREALRINPANAVVQTNLGNALFKQGNPEEAIAHLQKALELEPANKIIQTYLARILAATPRVSVRD